jgi:hypothetical protein
MRSCSKLTIGAEWVEIGRSPSTHGAEELGVNAISFTNSWIRRATGRIRRQEKSTKRSLIQLNISLFFEKFSLLAGVGKL